MVGAQSIVRFRAAIKDPMDIMFMFFSIASGIAPINSISQMITLAASFGAALALGVYLMLRKH